MLRPITWGNLISEHLFSARGLRGYSPSWWEEREAACGQCLRKRSGQKNSQAVRPPSLPYGSVSYNPISRHFPCLQIASLFLEQVFEPRVCGDISHSNHSSCIRGSCLTSTEGSQKYHPYSYLTNPCPYLSYPYSHVNGITATQIYPSRKQAHDFRRKYTSQALCFWA